MTQEIVVQEDTAVGHPLWAEFSRLNELILAKGKQVIDARIEMLDAMLTIAQERLWESAFPSVDEWLIDLYTQGVHFAARSTFYRKVEAFKLAQSLGSDRGVALSLAAFQEGAIQLLGKHVEVKKTGRGINAKVEIGRGSDIPQLERDPERYLETLSEQSPGAGKQMVQNDLGKTRIYVESALKSTLPKTLNPVGVQLNVVEEKPEGDFRYQVFLSFEPGTPGSVVESIVRRFKAGFSW